MSICNNISYPETGNQINLNQRLLDNIKYLPDSIRKEIRLLLKQYDIIEVQQCGDRYSFDENGNEYLLGTNEYGEYRFSYGCIKIQAQQYNIKITYQNKETKEQFFKLLLI